MQIGDFKGLNLWRNGHQRPAPRPRRCLSLRLPSEAPWREAASSLHLSCQVRVCVMDERWV